LISEAELEGQFVVSKGHIPAVPGSKRVQINTLSVDIFPRLRLVKVFDSDDLLIGCLLGTPIDIDGNRILEDRHELKCAAGTGPALDACIEREIYGLAGSFVFVLDLPQARRLYLDANGTLSVVYEAANQVAAATTLLVLSSEQEYNERLDHAFHTALRVDKDGWFPAGLTAHDGVRRLICNHYLDLDSWKCTRHWPTEPLTPEFDPGRSIKTIVEHTSRAIGALSKVAPTRLGLTAGLDTRLVLACSKKFLSDVSFITVDAPGAELDVLRARELSRRFGLKHHILPYVEANDEQMQTWQRKASHCVTGMNMKMHPSMTPLEDMIFVGGLGGEVGRGFLWLNSGDQTKLDASGLIARLKLPQHPRLLPAVEAWLEPLRGLDSLLILDLAYVELRMSSWGFAESYAHLRHVEINPLISRTTYSAMMSLHPSLRKNNAMLVGALKAEWPELLELPINCYGNWRDGYHRARAAITNPARALRKLRQLGSANLVNLYSKAERILH
jgi:hypothetical protein